MSEGHLRGCRSAGGVNPALLVNRPQHQLGVVFVEIGLLAHAVDFRGRRENDPLVVFDTELDDIQVFFEIEFEHRQGVADIGGRGGDGHQGQYQVALFDVILDPLVIDGDVTLYKAAVPSGLAQK